MSDKDIVEVAAATPEHPQPFAELGLTPGEYAFVGLVANDLAQGLDVLVQPCRLQG